MGRLFFGILCTTVLFNYFNFFEKIKVRIYKLITEFCFSLFLILSGGEELVKGKEMCYHTTIWGTVPISIKSAKEC